MNIKFIKALAMTVLCYTQWKKYPTVFAVDVFFFWLFFSIDLLFKGSEYTIHSIFCTINILFNEINLILCKLFGIMVIAMGFHLHKVKKKSVRLLSFTEVANMRVLFNITLGVRLHMLK